MDEEEGAHYSPGNVQDGGSSLGGERAPLLGKKGKRKMDAGDRKAMIALTVATVFTLVFMVGEIVGGVLANSLAIITDAAHLLTDVAAMLLSLVAMGIARRAPTKSMSFGFYRAEILGALASVLMIWALVGVLVYEAILRLIADIKYTLGVQPHPFHSLSNDDRREEGETLDGRIMTIIGVCGLVVNIVDALILAWGNAPHGHSHGPPPPPPVPAPGEEVVEVVRTHTGHAHSHGHGHGHEGNVNVRAALIHVLGDCIQSVGIIGAAVVVWVGNQVTTGSPSASRTYFNLADPIASLVFGVITLFTTVKILRQILGVLMETVPSHISFDLVHASLEAIDGVSSVHDLHIWQITLGKVYLSCHIRAEEGAEQREVLGAAQETCARYGINHATIQVDPHDLPECFQSTHE
ncbi:cation diffusion facilitator family transporter superfamily protein [Acanthamoeba castellanii str. Neff]|uniref:Cation diffusion facilitator family transporter superfamily protein n=1 Tax=Acanthamoeba castellanii (strain ATCC 30010 / Neff) TaxID=1257118 RepID=L8GNJ1_ACACF|nr:cation diffusion facilitator family transporter superfamily protein [Acanthamoeba castellanii str. Neff]ELR14615.1 cation diffusion facilitator family transporter superfamily protein [Acanthamoeba castellanii str. Neff]